MVFLITFVFIFFLVCTLVFFFSISLFCPFCCKANLFALFSNANFWLIFCLAFSTWQLNSARKAKRLSGSYFGIYANFLQLLLTPSRQAEHQMLFYLLFFFFSDNEIKIISLNVRGLANSTKRREIFNWLRAKKMSIYMLQEVHCSAEKSDLWSTERGYHSLFCSFSSRKSGVCILFNNNFELKVLKTFMDNEGRYVLCDMMANGKDITLVNLYAPNDDNPNFFNTLFTHLLDFQSEEIIIGGDFNLVLDIEKDKSGGLARTHLNAEKVVNDFCENMDLVDAWRILNPDISRFTWRQKHPEVHCRLDFVLVSQSILGNVTRTDITPGFQTDHSMISLNISSHTNKRGPGFWKLNTSLLNEEI